MFKLIKQRFKFNLMRWVLSVNAVNLPRIPSDFPLPRGERENVTLNIRLAALFLKTTLLKALCAY